MGLIQKLKSALGLDGAQSPEPGTATPGDVDVTVEREPSSESEDAVKGTETAGERAGESAEPDFAESAPEESSTESAPIEEAEPAVGDSAEADSAGDEATDEPASASGEDVAEESGDPITDINGIGPAYGQRLSDAGVDSVAELAAADAEELGAATDISANRIQGWIDAAAKY